MCCLSSLQSACVPSPCLVLFPSGEKKKKKIVWFLSVAVSTDLLFVRLFVSLISVRFSMILFNTNIEGIMLISAVHFSCIRRIYCVMFVMFLFSCFIVAS